MFDAGEDSGSSDWEVASLRPKILRSGVLEEGEGAGSEEEDLELPTESTEELVTRLQEEDEVMNRLASVLFC